jgi:hypothetical protein
LFGSADATGAKLQGDSGIPSGSVSAVRCATTSGDFCGDDSVEVDIEQLDVQSEDQGVRVDGYHPLLDRRIAAQLQFLWDAILCTSPIGYRLV